RDELGARHGRGGPGVMLAQPGHEHQPGVLPQDQGGGPLPDPRAGAEQLRRLLALLRAVVLLRAHRAPPSSGRPRGRVSSSISNSGSSAGVIAPPAVLSAASGWPTTSTASTTTTLTLSWPPPSSAQIGRAHV